MTEEIHLTRIHPSIEGQLRCVWSSHPDHTHNCREWIPRSVIAAAWELRCDGDETVEDFFHVSWRGGVWLAYGAPQGDVRGVYCPTHCAQREARGGLPAEEAAGPPVWAVAV
jgi:hypothetical protein